MGLDEGGDESSVFMGRWNGFGISFPDGSFEVFVAND